MSKRHMRIVASAAILAASLVIGAADLIYVEDDGGGGNPRGLYDFDPDTGISSLRATLAGGPHFFSLARRPSDGTVIAMHPLGSVLYTLDLNTGVSISRQTPVSTLLPTSPSIPPPTRCTG